MWKSTSTHFTAGFIVLLLLGGTVSARAADVSFELVTERGFPVTGAHKWIAMLRQAGLTNVRIRGHRPGDKYEIEKSGSGRFTTYKVRGLLSAGNVLTLPGGTKIRLTDVGKLRAWLAKLEQGGEQALKEKPVAFGLTSRQLVKLHEQLARKVPFETAGEAPRRTVDRIRSLSGVPTVIDSSGYGPLRSGEKVYDDLQGIAAGTALAAAVRPFGLVVEPRKEAGRELRLFITDFRKAGESWPVGWPPSDPDRTVLPVLFFQLNVELKDQPLDKVLTILEGRFKVPFLYDHNGMARQGIDLSQIKVSHPDKKTYYSRLLEQLLFQARLEFEVRVDEAGQPFVWISPLKKE